MIWETLSDEATSVVERAPYGDGHFVRMSWRHRRDIGIPPLEGSAVIYVPTPIPVAVQADPVEPLAPSTETEPETVDGEETEVA